MHLTIPSPSTPEPQPWSSVTVAGATYQLAQGNMFVIRMTEDWTPIVRQIEARRDEQTTEEKALDHFKSILRDDVSIQQLELN